MNESIVNANEKDSWNEHLNNKANPHSITPEQIQALRYKTIYYPDQTIDINTILDSLFLISNSASKNCPIQTNFIYICQFFYGGTAIDNNRIQIAYPYGTPIQNNPIICIRSYHDGVWSNWTSDAIDLTKYMELNGSKDCSITNDNPHFTAKQSDVTRGVIPTTNHWCQPFRILDSAEQTMCALESGYLTNGDNRVNLIVYKGNEVSSANAQIAVGFQSDGSWFTYAPTPITTDNSTKIATTAYVTSKLNEGNKPTIYTLTAGTPDGNTFYLKVEYFKVGKVVFCQQYCEIYNSNYYGDSYTSAMRVQLPVGFRPSTSSFSKGYPTQGDCSSSSYGSMAKVTSSGYAGMQVWKTNGNYAYKQMFWFTD